MLVRGYGTAGPPIGGFGERRLAAGGWGRGWRDGGKADIGAALNRLAWTSPRQVRVEFGMRF
jgi:hypothetical protein